MPSGSDNSTRWLPCQLYALLFPSSKGQIWVMVNDFVILYCSWKINAMENLGPNVLVTELWFSLLTITVKHLTPKFLNYLGSSNWTILWFWLQTLCFHFSTASTRCEELCTYLLSRSLCLSLSPSVFLPFPLLSLVVICCITQALGWHPLGSSASSVKFLRDIGTLVWSVLDTYKRNGGHNVWYHTLIEGDEWEGESHALYNDSQGL